MFDAFARILPDVPVIPNVEGGPPVPSFEANQRHFGHFSTRDNPKEIDPLALTTPYGHRLYHKLLKHLEHEEVVLRQKAAEGLVGLLNEKEESVVMALRLDALSPLLRALTDPDVNVRVNAAACIARICAVPAGQEAVDVSETALDGLLASLQDPNAGVVFHCLTALRNLHAAWNNYKATERAVARGAIDVYLDVVLRTAVTPSPAASVALPALAALRSVCDLKEGVVKILDGGAVALVTAVLRGDLVGTSPALLLAIGEFVAALAVFSNARAAFAAGDGVGALLPFLTLPRADAPPAARAAAVAVAGAVLGLSLEPAVRRQLTAVGVADFMKVILEAASADGYVAREPLVGPLLRIGITLADDAIGRAACAPLLPSAMALADSSAAPPLTKHLARKLVAELQRNSL